MQPSPRIDVSGARYPVGADGASRYNMREVLLAETATPAVMAARNVVTNKTLNPTSAPSHAVPAAPTGC
jgi:chorismate-pyruvate lyase